MTKYSSNQQQSFPDWIKNKIKLYIACKRYPYLRTQIDRKQKNKNKKVSCKQ